VARAHSEFSVRKGARCEANGESYLVYLPVGQIQILLGVIGQCGDHLVPGGGREVCA